VTGLVAALVPETVLLPLSMMVVGTMTALLVVKGPWSPSAAVIDAQEAPQPPPPHRLASFAQASNACG
jgi:hypothetical protein